MCALQVYYVINALSIESTYEIVVYNGYCENQYNIRITQWLAKERALLAENPKQATNQRVNKQSFCSLTAGERKHWEKLKLKNSIYGSKTIMS
jgi:hypothetical protein